MIYGIRGSNAGHFFLSGSVFKMLCNMCRNNMYPFKAGSKKQTFQVLLFRKRFGCSACLFTSISINSQENKGLFGSILMDCWNVTTWSARVLITLVYICSWRCWHVTWHVTYISLAFVRKVGIFLNVFDALFFHFSVCIALPLGDFHINDLLSYPMDNSLWVALNLKPFQSLVGERKCERR